MKNLCKKQEEASDIERVDEGKVIIEGIKEYTYDMHSHVKHILAQAAAGRMKHKFEAYQEQNKAPSKPV